MTTPQDSEELSKAVDAIILGNAVLPKYNISSANPEGQWHRDTKFAECEGLSKGQVLLLNASSYNREAGTLATAVEERIRAVLRSLNIPEDHLYKGMLSNNMANTSFLHLSHEDLGAVRRAIDPQRAAEWEKREQRAAQTGRTVTR